jgi:hypothetical protein
VIEVCGGLVLFEFRARTNLALIYLELQLKDKAAVEIARCREIIAAAGDWRSCVGDLHRAEGVLASFSENIPEAESHFANAIQIYRRYSLPFEEADTLHYWGRELNAHGDAVRATEKFDAAIEIYHQIGAGQRWIERIEKAAARTRTDNAISSSAEHNQFRRDGAQWNIKAQFRKEGDYWTVSYGGETFRLQDSKACGIIVHLLHHPGHQFHARELAALNGQFGTTGRALDRSDADQVSDDLRDAGPGLDARARAEYQHRLGELRADIDEAERDNDLGRAEKLRAEADALSAVIIREAGFRGRERKQSSHSERARLAVTKSIHRGIEKIRELSPALGRHLANSIRTGYFCSYAPDQESQVTWQL